MARRSLLKVIMFGEMEEDIGAHILYSGLGFNTSMRQSRGDDT